MSGTRIGKIQILGTLGTGAHSTIFRIRRNADSKHYALKVVPISGPQDAKFLKQARHEFRVAQLLDHPNLIKIYSLEIQRDWLFHPRKVNLLIEYVNGKTLDTLKLLAVPKLVQIFARVAAGMAHMHRRNVYHADMKPNNVMLSRAGDVKIIDYGLAWIKGEDKDRIQGTPEYMAPEQIKAKVVDERTDIYNLGATMYRLMTLRYVPGSGDIPLDGRSLRQLIKPVKECNAAAPDDLCDLIHRCLEFNPSKRPERMAEVRDALDQMIEQLVRSPDDRLEAIEW
jgi:serine/threonine protein kinase